MAKYDIKHTCCGAEQRIELYGKISERKQKIAWLESKPCQRCATPELKLRLILMGDLIEVQAIGGTYPVREQLKAAGMRFSRELGSGMMSLERAKIGWVWSCPVADRAALEGKLAELKAAGLPDATLVNGNPIEVAVAVASLTKGNQVSGATAPEGTAPGIGQEREQDSREHDNLGGVPASGQLRLW